MDKGPSTPVCALCKKDLPSPSKRRRLSVSAGESSKLVREFLTVFTPGDDGLSDSYLCKSCFKRTETLQRQLVGVENGINALRAQRCGTLPPIQLLAVETGSESPPDSPSDSPPVPLSHDSNSTQASSMTSSRRSRRVVTPTSWRSLFGGTPQSSEVKVGHYMEYRIDRTK